MACVKWAWFTASVVAFLALIAFVAWLWTRGMPHGPVSVTDKLGPLGVVLGVIAVAAAVIGFGITDRDD